VSYMSRDDITQRSANLRFFLFCFVNSSKMELILSRITAEIVRLAHLGAFRGYTDRDHV